MLIGDLLPKQSQCALRQHAIVDDQERNLRHDDVGGLIATAVRRRVDLCDRIMQPWFQQRICKAGIPLVRMTMLFRHQKRVSLEESRLLTKEI